MCIVLIKDKNCNTVCTSPEGGMDIQIKTLHKCMNEYNSSPQYVKGGNINYWLKLNAAICVFLPEEKKTPLQVDIFQIITSVIQS